MNQHSLFHEEKQLLRERLEALAVECRNLQRDLTLDLSDVIDKVRHGISGLQQQRITVALVGPFSEGKSTILAMLTKRMDIPISPEPTTDQVRVYETDDWKLCDTPGLFSDQPDHDAKTLQYVSEAQMVLFVTDPMNPLKESHASIVRFLLGDLRKQEATIFVINKMDMVADLEDAEAFRRTANLKVGVMREALRSIMGRAIEAPVLALAADPHKQGVAYWLEHPDDYQSLSRLSELERYVQEHIRTASQQLIVVAGFSVVRDAIRRITDQIGEIRNGIDPTLRVFNNRVNEIGQDLERLERKIVDAYTAIKSDVLERRKALLLDIDACQRLDQVVAFLQREVGTEGHALNHNLEVVIQRHTQALSDDVSAVMREMEQSIEVHDGLLAGSGRILSHPVIRTAFDSLRSASTKELSQGILWLRDALSLPIKFKPYGALKVGGFVRLLGWIGPVIEGGQVLAAWLAERKLKQTIAEVKTMLEEGFRSFLEEFSQERYIQKFFPQLKGLRELDEQLRRQRNDYAALSTKLIEGELRLKKLLP